MERDTVSQFIVQFLRCIGSVNDFVAEFFTSAARLRLGTSTAYRQEEKHILAGLDVAGSAVRSVRGCAPEALLCKCRILAVQLRYVWAPAVDGRRLQHLQ
ncbi:transcriptional regulator MarR family protein [Trichinella spiralis]|uniref:transcriptional regulator MarR family protein n=1 Tax=Trichinella spiralis TaxID=6334 RepID=UPI0001EFBF34|nr:transcriptional regulator MarR family protein [Trichinella spiralis]